MRRKACSLLVGAMLVSAVSFTGCARPTGRFVWVDQIPSAPIAGDAYVIGPGDLLNIQVWNQERISSRARVRVDGRVSLPLIGDVVVVGRTIEQTARGIEARLEETKIVVGPRVAVLLEESRPLSIGVLGTVARPGMYNLDPGAGVAEALASAGGLTEFARRDHIFVVRRLPLPLRIRFTFEDITQARGRAATFRLQAGDVVVVE